VLNVTDYIVLFASGCLGGVIAGLLGVGGGVINVFILTFYADKLGIESVDQVRFILGNSLFAIFFSSVFGSVQQIKNKNFYFKEVGLTTITAILANILVSYTILKFEWYSKERFSIFFIIILSLLTIKMIITVRKQNTTGFKDKIAMKLFAPLGFLAGIFSALTGLGGGVVMVPYMSDFYKLKIKKATSISLGVMPFMTLATSVLYTLFDNSNSANALGYIRPEVVIPMGIGVMICAPLGVKLAARISEKKIRLAFILIVLIVIARMISRIL